MVEIKSQSEILFSELTVQNSFTTAQLFFLPRKPVQWFRNWSQQTVMIAIYVCFQKERSAIALYLFFFSTGLVMCHQYCGHVVELPFSETEVAFFNFSWIFYASQVFTNIFSYITVCYVISAKESIVASPGFTVEEHDKGRKQTYTQFCLRKGLYWPGVFFFWCLCFGERLLVPNRTPSNKFHRNALTSSDC